MSFDFSSLDLARGASSQLLRPLLPTLQAGSVFRGHQAGHRRRYPVVVEIKHVNLESRVLDGHLTIRELSSEHPIVCTYFYGEIIDNEAYSFHTAKWGADDATDRAFWGNFRLFDPSCISKWKSNAPLNPLTDDYVYMRWKEVAVVADPPVAELAGLSLSNFIYVCLKKSDGGKLLGFYHSRGNDGLQALKLQHVERKEFASYEFA